MIGKNSEEERVTYFQQQRRSWGLDVALGGRVLNRAYSFEIREGKVRQPLRVLLLPSLPLTEIPHIYNDNMQTFPPGGK